MTTLEIGIAVAAILVVLTVLWSIRSARNAPPSRQRRSPDIRQRAEERDLL
jgi:hypothetical protein